MSEGCIVQIINTGVSWPAAVRRWLAPGEPMTLAPRLVMTLSVDRVIGGCGERYEPAITIKGPGAYFHATIPTGCCIDAAGWAAVRIMPRAVELVGGRPARVLVEFEPAQRACRVQ